MTPILILVGALSVYHPGDGHNAGTLACGGRFTWQQEHIAIRQWRRVGCGAKARVCVDVQRNADGNDDRRVDMVRGVRSGEHSTGATLARATRTCIWTEVRDSGPWGAKHPDGRWEVQIKLQPGWYRRAVVDLSWALWVRLGKPRFRSPVHITIWRKRSKKKRRRR